MIIRDSMENEAVAVAVSSFDDFLLRFRARRRILLLGLGIFSKIPQESSLRNAFFF